MLLSVRRPGTGGCPPPARDAATSLAPLSAVWRCAYRRNDAAGATHPPVVKDRVPGGRHSGNLSGWRTSGQGPMPTATGRQTSTVSSARRRVASSPESTSAFWVARRAKAGASSRASRGPGGVVPQAPAPGFDGGRLRHVHRSLLGIRAAPLAGVPRLAATPAGETMVEVAGRLADAQEWVAGRPLSAGSPAKGAAMPSAVVRASPGYLGAPASARKVLPRVSSLSPPAHGRGSGSIILFEGTVHYCYTKQPC